MNFMAENPQYFLVTKSEQIFKFIAGAVEEYKVSPLGQIVI